MRSSGITERDFEKDRDTRFNAFPPFRCFTLHEKRGKRFGKRKDELPFILSGRVSIPIGVVSVSRGVTDRDVILTDKYRYKNTMYKY